MSGLLLENIFHAFGDTQVIRGVSAEVQSGEFVCLLGPSGCGKTTLLRLAAGLEPLQRGRIAIGGDIVADPESGASVPPERRGTGLMFQDFALFPHMSVFGNITFGVPNPSIDQRDLIRSSMNDMGISDLADAYPHMLSGGQQQRVALLRALAPQPRVLLLDEPFSGLDVNLRMQIREETLALLKKTEVATLMVTHDPQEALFMADRILVMNGGRIAQVGTPREIYQFPATEFIARFVGQTNILPGIILDSGYDEVMTSIGPIPCLSMRGLDFGTDAFISIRPESFALDPEGPFLAEVQEIRYGGHYTILEVELLEEIGKGQILRIHAHPNRRIDIGETIRFRVIPDFVTIIEDLNSTSE
ncbi:ABC transporter ATP-binding protein [Nitrospinota bacterium]